MKMFQGVTALLCSACDITFSTDVPLLKEPTKDEWTKLLGILNNRENLCKCCQEAMKCMK